MNKIHMFWRYALVIILCLSIVSLVEAQSKGNGRLKAEFDEELTPLQSAISDIVEDRKGNGKEHPTLTLKCANPNSNNPKCQVLDEPCLDCGEITNRQGKVVGRKNRTETIIEYDKPGQRNKDMAKFDRIKVGGRKSDGFGAGTGSSWKDIKGPDGREDLKTISDRDAAASVGGQIGESNPTQAKLRRGRSGLAEPVNNDSDCIDAVTREWAREDGCFDDGKLLVTLEELIEEDEDGNLFGIGCEHIASGEVFSESPDDDHEGVCYDEYGNFKDTSLEELIDEDGPDFAEQIDQDGDGMFDEDPSESGDVLASCRAFYENLKNN